MEPLHGMGCNSACMYICSRRTIFLLCPSLVRWPVSPGRARTGFRGLRASVRPPQLNSRENLRLRCGLTAPRIVLKLGRLMRLLKAFVCSFMSVSRPVARLGEIRKNVIFKYDVRSKGKPVISSMTRQYVEKWPVLNPTRRPPDLM